MIETKNAKIISTMLGKEDHGIMTFSLTMEFEGGVQGFGGCSLDDYSKTKKKRIGAAYGMQLIMELLDTLECSTWEDLDGRLVRIKADRMKIYAIGHILKDQWLDIDEFFKRECK